MQVRKLVGLSLFWVVLGAVAPAQANLITNGTFDVNGDDWTETGAIGVTFAGGVAKLGVPGTPGTSTLGQTFGLGGASSLLVSFDYDFFGPDSATPPDDFTVELLLTGGSTPIINLLSLSGSLNPTQGSVLSFSGLADVTGATSAELLFTLVEQNGSQTSGGTAVWIDNVSAAAVPAPFSLGLLFAAGLGLFFGRRRAI